MVSGLWYLNLRELNSNPEGKVSSQGLWSGTLKLATRPFKGIPGKRRLT